METADKEKKNNYPDAFLKKCWHFTPFLVSVVGLPGVKSEATLQRIASHLANKFKEP